MKHTLIYLVALLLITSNLGCTKDFLDEVNKSAITQENYFTTAAQAQAAVTGIYPMLQTLNNEIEFRGDAVWSLLEMPVGHINPGGS